MPIISLMSSSLIMRNPPGRRRESQLPRDQDVALIFDDEVIAPADQAIIIGDEEIAAAGQAIKREGGIIGEEEAIRNEPSEAIMLPDIAEAALARARSGSDDENWAGPGVRRRAKGLMLEARKRSRFRLEKWKHASVTKEASRKGRSITLKLICNMRGCESCATISAFGQRSKKGAGLKCPSIKCRAQRSVSAAAHRALAKIAEGAKGLARFAYAGWRRADVIFCALNCTAPIARALRSCACSA